MTMLQILFTIYLWQYVIISCVLRHIFWLLLLFVYYVSFNLQNNVCICMRAFHTREITLTVLILHVSAGLCCLCKTGKYFES